MTEQIPLPLEPGKKPLRLTVYRDVSNFWRWRLIGANDRTLGCSSESYQNRAAAIRNAELVTGASLPSPKGARWSEMEWPVVRAGVPA